MIDWVLKFEWNGLLGICLYWAPLAFCAVFYTARTAGGYMEDKRNRAKASSGSYYHPRETVGRILGRALVTVLPVANLWAALFDLSPKVFARIFDALARIFDQPLVPPLK
jgi:hypothetical protein